MGDLSRSAAPLSFIQASENSEMHVHDSLPIQPSVAQALPVEALSPVQAVWDLPLLSQNVTVLS